MLIVAVGGAAALWGPGLWDRYADQTLSTERCTVTLGDRTDTKTAEQADNIALIVAGSLRWGLPARAATIAVATAIQESSLRNIDYGDRDSIGLFQQRPSQGWGTVEQIMDPYYSTDRFYEGLVKVDGWDSMEITDAAQAVQRSGFPQAYADHEEEGRLWASALTGNGGDVTCELNEAQPVDVRAFLDRVAADFGEGTFAMVVTDGTGTTTALTGTDAAGDATREAALQQWAVAVASTQGVEVSAQASHTWTRDGETADAPPAQGTTVEVRTG